MSRNSNFNVSFPEIYRPFTVLAAETLAGEALPLIRFLSRSFQQDLFPPLNTRYKTSDEAFFFGLVCFSSPANALPPKLPNVAVSIALQRRRVVYLLGSSRR